MQTIGGAADAGQPQARGRPARGGFPEHAARRRPGAPLRRHRFRHPGQLLRCDELADRRAPRRRRHRRLRAGRLPDRPRVRARAEAGLEGRSRGAGEEGIQGRAPDAQLPGHRDPRGAAAARRDERPEHRGQRHRAGQRHAAPAERAVGPGARHRAAHQGPRQAPRGQRHLRRAVGGARGPREADARGAQGGGRAFAGAYRVPAGQLRQGFRPGVADQVAGQELAPLRARQRLDRRADQHAAAAGHGGAARGHPAAGVDPRHPGAAGADRGAHRHRQRRFLSRELGVRFGGAAVFNHGGSDGMGFVGCEGLDTVPGESGPILDPTGARRPAAASVDARRRSTTATWSTCRSRTRRAGSP